MHRYGHLTTPDALEVLQWHTEQVFKTYKGSAQIDFKFHGANDNMPVHATSGLILGGETLGNKEAIRHGVWNLNQLRRLLSRGAWMSEFNSSTYTGGTVSGIAAIASFSYDPDIRTLALDIEHTIWAEMLLHFHPGTFMQAGPQSRAYPADYAGHPHIVQMLLWLNFGPRISGRDMVQNIFAPDGLEIQHFSGMRLQTAAEYCWLMDTDYHVPDSLRPLAEDRAYPARLRGRSEAMSTCGDRAASYHTQTYMEPEFSLGTVDVPMRAGGHTSALHATYRRTKEPKDWRDAATIFYRYQMSNEVIAAPERSIDGGYVGEHFTSNRGYCYTLQKDNVAALLCTPFLSDTPVETDTLKMRIVFPAHYGSISRSIVGEGTVSHGGVADSQEVVPVSFECGEVYVHIQPLMPTELPRTSAIRLVRENRYEILDLITYEGPKRSFDRFDLSMALNGFVFTISPRTQWKSLEEFHRANSQSVITDYVWGAHRFFLFRRDDVEFEIVMTPNAFGAQTERVDGRHVHQPIFESNQIDVSKLPFTTGPVARNTPHFPWKDNPTAWHYETMPWLIGSRGLPGEKSYSRRVQDLKR